MKKKVALVTLAVVAVILAGLYAVKVYSPKQPPAPAAAAPKSQNLSSDACKAVQKICEDAGFIVGQMDVGNGVWANCAKPLSRGEKVREIVMNDKLKADLTECSTNGGM